MIPFGPFRPDAALVNASVCLDARNCVPTARGYGPLKSPVGATSALPTACVGSAVILEEDGDVTHLAGTSAQLYKLGPTGTWAAHGAGGYSVPVGDQWKFSTFSTNILATNIADGLQMSSGGAAFSAVAGAPKGRYITTVRDFVFLGSMFGHEGRVQWSELGNASGWTPGTNSSDYQDAQSGGPVRGVIGGETGYLMQAQRVVRMTFVPGSTEIFQFDEVEGARGLAAPHSLIRIGRQAWYLSQDGFYEFDVGAGASVPIGVGKWADFFQRDIRKGSEFLTLGTADPISKKLVWVYVSSDSTTNIPNRAFLYDWVLQDGTIVDVTAESGVQWLTQGYTLDTINSFGTLETLPFSLDSSFWRGGAGLLGMFTTDHKLSVFEGPNMAASWTTADGHGDSRVLITGTRPQANAEGITVAISTRERDADAVVFDAAEAMEDTGIVPAFSSGNYARARITIPAGQSWDAIKGVNTIVKRSGSR